ncbi:unnamed protein product [Merluccius merluccius]
MSNNNASSNLVILQRAVKQLRLEASVRRIKPIIFSDGFSPDVRHVRTAGRPAGSGPGLSDVPQTASWWGKKRDQHVDSGSSLREQLLEQDQHVAEIKDMLRTEREKVSRLQVRCVQQEAQLRRSEQLSNRLKERLHPDRHRERGPSMEVLNLVPGGGRKRQQENKSSRITTRYEETALRGMLERREAELREAMKLRHSTTTLLHALKVNMEQSLQDLDQQEAFGNHLRQLVQAEADLGDHVTGGVVQSWLKVQRRLGPFLFEGHPVVGTDQDKLMLAQLEMELEETQNLVKLQQQLLQDGLFSPLPSDLADSYFLEEWGRLQAKWAELHRQRQNFERERQSFTDAAIRLSRQQRDFEQEKASLLKQQFLGDSLFFKGSHSSDRRGSTTLDFSGLEPMSISCCHPASPSSTTESASSVQAGSGHGHRPRRVSVRTPSTPALYFALNLPYTFRAATFGSADIIGLLGDIRSQPLAAN